jgi:hypothetical protein
VLVIGILGTFGYNSNVFIPLLARDALAVDAAGYGLLFSCLGVGSVIAAFGLAGRRGASERTLLAGGTAFTMLLFLVALSPWFLVTAGLLALLGAAGIVFSTTANTRLQLAAPAEMRGRVMSLYEVVVALDPIAVAPGAPGVRPATQRTSPSRSRKRACRRSTRRPSASRGSPCRTTW